MAANSSLGVRISRKSGLVCVTITGEMDLSNAASFEPAGILRQCDRHSPIHLDLTAVPYMDSTALRRVLLLHKLARSAGVPLTIYLAPNSLVHRLMRVVGATEVLNVMTVPTDS